MAYSEALAERIRAVLAHDTAITEKKMFGGLAFLHHGLMLVGVSGSKLMARVGKDAYAVNGNPKLTHVDSKRQFEIDPPPAYG